MHSEPYCSRGIWNLAAQQEKILELFGVQVIRGLYAVGGFRENRVGVG